jgi:hypothetical protein
MRPYITFFLLTISLVFFSCKKDKKKVDVPDNNLSYIYWDSLTAKNLIMENIDRCKFVKLQTTDDCLIKEIKKIDMDDGKLFIRDDNRKIFVFTDKGEFLNTVSQIGPGPQELFCVRDFCLDKKNKQVLVFDCFKSAIFRYSYSGKFIDIIKVDKNVFNNTDFYTMIMTEDNSLILYETNRFSSVYTYRVISGEKFDKSEDFVPYIALGEKGFSENIVTTSSPNGEIYFTSLASDTIYKYNSNTRQILPETVFKGRYRPINNKDIEGKKFETAFDVLFVSKEKGLSFGVKDIGVTDKYIHFMVLTIDGSNRVFWDRHLHKGYYSPLVTRSTINNVFNFLKAAIDNTFICAIPAESFAGKEALWSENETVRNVSKNTLEDDNPIIAFYYFD